MIRDRNIVIKREGDKLLLPTVERKEVDAPVDLGKSTFLMCRILSYDQHSGTMELKLLPDRVNDPWMFQIAIEENSDLLSPLNINKLVFTGKEPPAYFFDLGRIGDGYEVERRLRRLSEHLSKGQKKVEEKIIDKEEKPKLTEIDNLTLQLHVKYLKFSDGKVSYEYYINKISRKVTFDIHNGFIKKAHDSIKNYFPKILKIDKFSIFLQYEYLDGKLLSYTSSSLEISRIDESLFEIVEDLYIQDNIINNSQDGIFSINEIATKSSKTIGSDKIQDAQWLLNKLITKERTKHYYHLRFLSDKHLSDKFHLLLTGAPLSFIFLLPTQGGYCLIWETYLTEEATYVWKLKSKEDLQMKTETKELLELIKWLRGNNKMTYLRRKPENFTRIEHDYSGDDFGFKKWKNQLEGFFWEE